jgi:hypothetical protein
MLKFAKVLACQKDHATTVQKQPDLGHAVEYPAHVKDTVHSHASSMGNNPWSVISLFNILSNVRASLKQIVRVDLKDSVFTINPSKILHSR